MFYKDKTFSLIFLFISVFIFITALQYPMFSSYSVVGAGFIPIITAGTLLFLSIGLLVKNSMNSSQEVDHKDRKVSREAIVKQLSFLMILIMSIPLINVFGMIFTIGLVLFASMRYIEQKSIVMSFAFSVIMTIGIYLSFELWLDARLPAGVFEFVIGG